MAPQFRLHTEKFRFKIAPTELLTRGPTWWIEGFQGTSLFWPKTVDQKLSEIFSGKFSISNQRSANGETFHISYERYTDPNTIRMVALNECCVVALFSVECWNLRRPRESLPFLDLARSSEDVSYLLSDGIIDECLYRSLGLWACLGIRSCPCGVRLSPVGGRFARVPAWQDRNWYDLRQLH